MVLGAAATRICTPWSGSTLLLAGYELLGRPPRALESSAEAGGSGCCRSVLGTQQALLVPQVSPSLGMSGRRWGAVWEQKERCAFSENAVERPLVPLQSYGVRREERQHRGAH